MRSIEIPQPEDRDWRYRSLEILPGALTWLILASPLILGLISPRLAAYFIVAYLLLWFIRAIGLNVRSLQGFRMINKHRLVKWEQLNQDLEVLEASAVNPPKWHAGNVARVKKNITSNRIKPSEVFHAILVATYNESREVLEPTIKSVIASDYDMNKVILIVAYEGRDGARSEKPALELIQEYGSQFYHAEAIRHPLTEGEVRGKGGNISYAGRKLQKYLEEQDIDPMHVLVTTLDSDNRPDRHYLSALTYTFCSTEEPRYASYQPVAMYLNNIWDAPAPMRVIATGNSFWQVIQTMRPHTLRNFSAHAQPMAALIDTDFWSVRTIVEDGHQYWRTWFRYDGHHDVYPIFAPIYQDAVLADGYRRTLKAQFIQVRRWAWGASDIAYVGYTGFLKPNRIPRYKIWSKFLRLTEGHISWSTSPLILLLAALIPFFLHPQSYIANQLPQVASKLNQVALLGILVTLYLSMRSLPPKPARYKRRRNLWMAIQWVYLPLTTIAYSSFAAIYSQTRLMFGWYIGKFDVTEKAVVNEKGETIS